MGCTQRGTSLFSVDAINGSTTPSLREAISARTAPGFMYPEAWYSTSGVAFIGTETTNRSAVSSSRSPSPVLRSTLCTVCPRRPRWWTSHRPIFPSAPMTAAFNSDGAVASAGYFTV